MTRKRLFAFATVSVVVGGVAFFGGRSLRSQWLFTPSSKAFTIELTETGFRRTDGARFAKPLFRARRSDGSRVDGFSVPLPDNTYTTTSTITLTAEKKRVLVHNHTQSTTSFPITDETVQYLRARPDDPSCTTHPHLLHAFRIIGTDTFLGYKVVKLVYEEAKYTQERWEAPELDCEPLFERVDKKDPSGNVYYTSETTATRVVVGEPRHELFTSPDKYTEQSPSELWKAASARFGNPSPAIPDAAASKLSKLDALHRQR